MMDYVLLTETGEGEWDSPLNPSHDHYIVLLPL